MDNNLSIEEVLKMLANVTSFVAKVSNENDRLSVDCKKMKNRLMEANKKNLDLIEQLQESESSYSDKIGFKTKIIAMKNEELKTCKAMIAHKNAELKKMEAIVERTSKKFKIAEKIIQEQQEQLVSLSDTIDQKELIIIQKEEIIDSKIEWNKSQELKAAELNNTISSLEKSIEFLEDENIKLRGISQNEKDLHEYIDFLHATLERNNIFGELTDSLRNGDGHDATNDVSATKQKLWTIYEEDEDLVPTHDCSSTEHSDIHNDKVLLSDDDFLYELSEEYQHSEKNIRANKKAKSPKSIFTKKSNKKKKETPIKKKVRFSKLITVANF